MSLPEDNDRFEATNPTTVLQTNDQEEEEEDLHQFEPPPPPPNGLQHDDLNGSALVPRAPMPVVQQENVPTGPPVLYQPQQQSQYPPGYPVAQIEGQNPGYNNQWPGSPTSINSASALIVEKELQHEMVLKNEQIATAQVGNANVTAVKGAELKVQTAIKQRHEIVETDSGMRLRRVTQVEMRVYAQIYEDLYIEAINEKEHGQLAIEQGEEEGDPAVDATCCEKCTDYCCQACTCNFQNPFSRQKKKPNFETKEIMTPILRRGRAKGWGIYNKMIFPLVRDTLRDVWVIAELLTILIALILSITSFVKGKKEIFNSLHLGLAILSTLLALIDAFLSLRECKSCKACYQCATAHKRDNEEAGGADPNETKERCNNCCCRCCRKTSDTLRVLFTEAILYPLLLCDIFELIVGKSFQGENAEDRLSFALFLLSSFSLVLYVYVVRLLILIGMIHTVNKERKPFINNPTEYQRWDYDPSIANSALYFQVYFFIHVFGQMVAQILMIVAIGGKIRYDNRCFYNPFIDDENCSIQTSPTLWYMMIAGYIMPFFGFMTFFIATNYWTQEFPIGLCIDFVTILQMPGADDIINIKETLKDEKKTKLAGDLIAHFVRIEKLKEQFKELKNTKFLDKFAYPFKSPALVIISMTYAFAQFGFILCAALALDENGVTITHVLNGGGWVIYYIIAVILAVIANLYVFAVAAFWTAIIVAVIALVALIIAGLILLCMAASCASSNTTERRHYY